MRKKRKKKLFTEFHNLSAFEIACGLIKILTVYVVMTVLLVGGIWVFLSPRVGYREGGFSMVNPFNGFRFYVNKNVTSVIDVDNDKKLKDGILNIPDSFLGRPVDTVSLVEYNENIKIVNIPDSVTNIERLRISSLAEVTGGAEVREIGDDAFKDCVNLVRISHGNKLERIGRGAFSECAALKEIKLGNMISIIYAPMFRGCESLERVELGYSLSEIGEETFYNCTSLKEVLYAENVSYIGENAFQGTPWSETEEGKRIIEEKTKDRKQ